MGFSRADYVHRRKAKYMAQTLEEFEKTIEPHLPPEAAGDVQNFKGLTRARFNALAKDSVEIMNLDGGVNGVALEMRDSLSPVGRP